MSAKFRTIAVTTIAFFMSGQRCGGSFLKFFPEINVCCTAGAIASSGRFTAAHSSRADSSQREEFHHCDDCNPAQSAGDFDDDNRQIVQLHGVFGELPEI